MSSDRSNNTAGRPLKPTLASNRSARTPLTPRIAGNATPTLRASAPKLTATARTESPRLTPHSKQSDDGLMNVTVGGAGNVTPRSSARRSRVGVADGMQVSPGPSEDTPSAPRPTTAIMQATVSSGRNVTAFEVNGGGAQRGTRVDRPKSTIGSGNGSVRAKSPLVRAPGMYDSGSALIDESIESRFFHASEVQKQEPAPPKRPEPKKMPSFFYADGYQEDRLSLLPNGTSSMPSSLVENRPSVPWMRTESLANMPRSPPMLSPALSALSAASSFFPAQQLPRSASPSKENIHLSYRKGASQIFGTRPLTRPAGPSGDVPVIAEEGRDSLDRHITYTQHRKSPSVSSIDSGNSHGSRRRSATNAEAYQMPSPLHHEVKTIIIPRLSSPLDELPTIDTSLDTSGMRSPLMEGALSPTKAASDFAADARRERKVLDLEISNSSLLAINTSLERELRRQKTELKRFRRLSRAGRFSSVSVERAARFSEGLSTLGEMDEVDDLDAFAPGLTNDTHDEFSDDGEDDSVTSGETTSPSVSSTRDNDRLAKDEKRLRLDLAKHKDLLVQSQMMNQTIKRCMYATEEMINEGKKALQYHVRVSDIRLGGRILSGHDEEDAEAIDVEDETLHPDDGTDDMNDAHGLLQVWQGVGRPSLESSEGGDRDSGIEVDQRDSGRPPDFGEET